MQIGFVLYLILFLLSIVLLTAAYTKSRNKKVFMLYLAVSGCTLLFDYLIYILGKGYKYTPGIIPGEYDSYIGALINSQIIPAAAILFAVFKGRWSWSMGLALLFSGIEILFVKVGIFEQYWWKPWYTVGFLIPFFPVVKVWWNRLGEQDGRWIKLATLVVVLYAIRIQLAIFQYAFLRTRMYKIEWLIELGVDPNAISTLLVLPWCIVLASLVVFRARRVWCFVALIIYCLLDPLMIMGGYVLVLQPWDWVLQIIGNVIAVLLALILGRMLRNEQR